MDLRRIGDVSLHFGREVHRFGDGESFSFAFVGGGDIGAQGEDALLRWNLQHQIDIMGHGHELGESWSAKDGVVGGVKVCHKEIHVLSTEVVGGAKLDWQGDLPQRLGRSARYNPPEWRINRDEIVLCEA